MFSASAFAQTTIRVNVAGPAYTDSASNVYAADSAGSWGSGSGTVDWGSQSISGTSDSTLYRTERYASDLTYAATVDNGTYSVSLHWAENYVDSGFPNGGIGYRLMNVKLEGATVESNLDVFALVGSHVALTKTYTVTVSDGQLNLEFPNGGFIDAIEIVPQSSGAVPSSPGTPTISSITNTSATATWTAATGSPAVSGYRYRINGGSWLTPTSTLSTSITGLSAGTSYTVDVQAQNSLGWGPSASQSFTTTGGGSSGTTIRVNAAGPAYTDTASNVYGADSAGNWSNSGGTVDWGSQSISGTSDPTLYRTERYGTDLAYAATVANGTYSVSLHWAENYIDSGFPNGGIGYRLMSVKLEGTTVDSNVDVFALVGSHAALTRTYTVTVSDGQLNIQLLGGGMINAIEIVPQSGGGSVPSAPGTPTVSSITNTSATATWTAATGSPAVSAYRYRINSGSWLTPTSTLSTSITGLSASTSYTVEVQAQNSVGWGPSASQSFTTTGGTSGGGTTLRVNAAGPAYTDGASNAYAADSAGNWTNSGGTVDWGSQAISGTSDATLYRTERYGTDLAYTATVANGTYSVTLHWAENYIDSGFPNGGIGYRLMTVKLEGTTVDSNVDVFALVGNHAALTRTYTVTVSDGQLNIQLLGGGMINAIEIVPQGGGGPDTTPPTVPTGLSASSVAASSLTIGWTASTDSGSGVAGYRIFRGGTQIGTSATTSFSDSGLAANTTYSYTVAAVDNASPANVSAQSAALSVQTSTSSGGSTSTYTYDTGGHLKTVVTGSSTVTYTYDAAGNLTNIQVTP